MSIKKITLKVNDRVIELTLEEAKMVFEDLTELLGGTKVNPIPSTTTVYRSIFPINPDITDDDIRDCMTRDS